MNLKNYKSRQNVMSNLKELRCLGSSGMGEIVSLEEISKTYFSLL